MIRFKMFCGVLVLAFALPAMAADATNNSRSEIATVEDPLDVRDPEDKAQVKRASKPTADDAGAGAHGSLTPDQPDEDPTPNQGSPDDGPRQPKPGCSVSGHEQVPRELALVGAALVVWRLRRRTRAMRTNQ
jgi:hypothetical protein